MVSADIDGEQLDICRIRVHETGAEDAVDGTRDRSCRVCLRDQPSRDKEKSESV